jgi:hypothetical protein
VRGEGEEKEKEREEEERRGKERKGIVGEGEGELHSLWTNFLGERGRAGKRRGGEEGRGGGEEREEYRRWKPYLKQNTLANIFLSTSNTFNEINDVQKKNT